MSEAAELWDERTGGTVARKERWLRGDRPPPTQVPAGHDPSRECVMKIVSFGKSARAGAATMSYIAEGSEHVEPGSKLHDAYGESFTPDEAAGYFDLVPDEENLSPAARALPEHLRSKLPEAERLRLRQTCHIVLSFPKADKVDPDTAHLIAQDFIAPWADNGYRAVYVPHLRQGRGQVHGPDHIHVVLAMASKDPGQPRLAMRKEDLHRMREHFREVAARHGIGMTATRRIDRKGLQPDLVAGRAPIRKPDEFEPKRRDRFARPQLLERQAPRWYSRHGAAWQASRAPEAVPDHAYLQAPAAALPALPPKAEAGLNAWVAQRFTPDAQPMARTRILEMLAEAPRTAMWYANKRPEVFGQVTAAPGLPRLTGRMVPVSKTWRSHALDTVRASRTHTEDDDRTYRLTLADSLKPKGDAAVQARSGAFASQWLDERYPAPDQGAQLGRHIHLRHVPAWLERHAARLTGASAPAPIDLPELPKGSAKVLDTWIRAHYAAEDRPTARAAFLEMHAERPQTAIAMAAEQPEAFAPHLRRAGRDLDPARLAIPAGWQEEARRAVAAAVPHAGLTQVQQEARAAFEKLIQEQSAVTDETLYAHLLREAGSEDTALERLQAVLADPDTVTVREDATSGQLTLSRRGLVEAEARLDETVRAMSADTEGAIGRRAADRTLRRFETEMEKATGFRLAEEQRHAVLAVTTGARLTAIAGAAGAGKSTGFEAARAVWTKAGFDVIGGAPSGIAAQALGQTGIPSSTLHRLQRRLDEEGALQLLRDTGRITAPARQVLGSGRADRPGLATATHLDDLDRDTRGQLRKAAERRLQGAIGRKSVVVIDEAGMVGTEALDRAVHDLKARGARVVLSGDVEQLQPIAAGAGLRLVQESTPPTALRGVRRQVADWQRDASSKLAEGEPKATRDAFTAYADRGHVRTGLSGYDPAQHARAAEQALGTRLSVHERRLMTNVLDYASARAEAGRAYAEGIKGNPELTARFAGAAARRNAAAERIGEDLDAHKPWLDRYGVDGRALAGRIVEARGVPKDGRDMAARGIVERHALDQEDPDVRLSRDFRGGARQALLADYRATAEAKPDSRQLILAATNEEVDRLNAGARSTAREIGRLDGPDRMVAGASGAAPLAKGDRIMFTANLYDGEPRQLIAANGALGTVAEIGKTREGSRLTVDLDAGTRIQVDPAKAEWRHGYAATVHRSQGATVDRVYVLDHPMMTKHPATVAMTRHREEVQVYSAAADAQTPKAVVDRWSEAKSKGSVSTIAPAADVLQRQTDPAARVATLDRRETRDRLAAAAVQAGDKPAPLAVAARPGSERPVPEKVSEDARRPATTSRELDALHEAAGRIVARRDALQVRQQLRHGIHEAETALRTLDRRREAAQDLDKDIQQRLPQVYRDPKAAGAAIRDRIETEGLTATVRAMHMKPESFGRLQGGGLLKDEARSRARGAAGEIASGLPAAEEARRRVAGDAGERQARETAAAAARAQLQGLDVPDVPNAQQLRGMLKEVPAEQRRQLLKAAERQVLAQHIRGERAGQRAGRVGLASGRDREQDYDIER